jgi:hypothetical protein
MHLTEPRDFTTILHERLTRNAFLGRIIDESPNFRAGYFKGFRNQSVHWGSVSYQIAAENKPATVKIAIKNSDGSAVTFECKWSSSNALD